MKRIYIILVVFVSVLSACHDESATFTLGVDVQASFDQDDVKILIDGNEVLNKTLETNNILGLCMDGQITKRVSEGTHSITVTVNNGTPKTETFLISNNRYIGVTYSQGTGAISFNFSDQPFLYD